MEFDFLIEKSLYLIIQYLINQTGPTFKSLEKLPFGSFFLFIPLPLYNETSSIKK